MHQNWAPIHTMTQGTHVYVRHNKKSLTFIFRDWDMGQSLKINRAFHMQDGICVRKTTNNEQQMRHAHVPSLMASRWGCVGG